MNRFYKVTLFALLGFSLLLMALVLGSQYLLQSPLSGKILKQWVIENKGEVGRLEGSLVDGILLEKIQLADEVVSLSLENGFFQINVPKDEPEAKSAPMLTFLNLHLKGLTWSFQNASPTPLRYLLDHRPIGVEYGIVPIDDGRWENLNFIQNNIPWPLSPVKADFRNCYFAWMFLQCTQLSMELKGGITLTQAPGESVVLKKEGIGQLTLAKGNSNRFSIKAQDQTLFFEIFADFWFSKKFAELGEVEKKELEDFSTFFLFQKEDRKS